MKRCPTCSELLSRWRRAAVEVDGCPACGGLWFDKGELKILSSDPEALRAADRQFPSGLASGAAHRTGLCPACTQPLAQFEYDQFRGIRLEKCRSCEGVWADRGEASALADRLVAPPPEAPPPALAEPSGLELARPPRSFDPVPEGPIPAPPTYAPPTYAPPVPAESVAPVEAPRAWFVSRGGMVLAAVAVVALGWYALHARPPRVGQDVARFTLQTPSGPRRLVHWTGQVLFIRFFAGDYPPPINCPNVQRALRTEAELRSKYAEAPVVFLSVNLDDRVPLRHHDDGWTVIPSANADLYRRFFGSTSRGCLTESFAFPSHVVIGKDGHLLHAGHGVKPAEFFREILARGL